MRFQYFLLSVILVAVGAGILVSRQLGVSENKKLPFLGKAPVFSLPHSGLETDEDELFSSAIEHSSPWVVSFFFTSCPGICPTLNAYKATLVERFPEVQFVSISVDPERDTASSLLKYSEQFGSPKNWIFLTGDRPQLKEIQEGFQLAASEDINFHSGRFVLMDKENNIRGFYHGTDKADVEELARDIQQLLKQ